MPSLHPDPWRDVDAQVDAAQLAKSLEVRGATRTQQVRIAGRHASSGLFLTGDEAIPVDGGLTASMPYAGKPI